MLVFKKEIICFRKLIFHVYCKTICMSDSPCELKRKVNRLKESHRVNELSEIFLDKAIILGKFDSRKNSRLAKLERRPVILVKLSFREMCNSKFNWFSCFW